MCAVAAFIHAQFVVYESATEDYDSPFAWVWAWGAGQSHEHEFRFSEFLQIAALHRYGKAASMAAVSVGAAPSPRKRISCVCPAAWAWMGFMRLPWLGEVLCGSLCHLHLWNQKMQGKARGGHVENSCSAGLSLRQRTPGLATCLERKPHACCYLVIRVLPSVDCIEFRHLRRLPNLGKTGSRVAVRSGVGLYNPSFFTHNVRFRCSVPDLVPGRCRTSTG